MQRTTVRVLKLLVDQINKVTGNPMRSYVKTEDGSYKSAIGCYHLSPQYGGIALHQMANDGGGVHVIFGTSTKRELEMLMRAYLKGMEDKEAA